MRWNARSTRRDDSPTSPCKSSTAAENACSARRFASSGRSRSAASNDSTARPSRPADACERPGATQPSASSRRGAWLGSKASACDLVGVNFCTAAAGFGLGFTPAAESCGAPNHKCLRSRDRCHRAHRPVGAARLTPFDTGAAQSPRSSRTQSFTTESSVRMRCQKEAPARRCRHACAVVLTHPGGLWREPDSAHRHMNCKQTGRWHLYPFTAGAPLSKRSAPRCSSSPSLPLMFAASHRRSPRVRQPGAG